ncbi:squalene synthase HpnC [Comamonas kerstersii]|uniref:squalene synthase HpnC n=1 Tax=Comamonas kerstersii TaxID=225992 RepID=UPI0009CC82E6|nr:squalene synthase HpnC [Comamonas kerstersii]OOH88656.1 squalene synthase HpnC [Comamonas kerstersii]OOH94878.1 squalene synthase HpnC [Comamonas kerstersii]
MKASSPPSAQAAHITHYENFPVASWLCPAALRPPIAAIYAFARTADDMADEGDASPAQRLEQLQDYRLELHAIAKGQPPQPRWATIFTPLQYQLQQWQLPVHLLDDLLSAFVQDVAKTRDQTSYADRAELLDYCRRSANPVGRLLLHLYGVHDDQALAQSDAICSALQLINFWQDLSEDIPRGRHYLTDADCARFNVSRTQLNALQLTLDIQRLIASNTAWARTLMQQGAPLVHRLPGRIGWELRLVVQGGLRILDKVQAQQGHNLHTRLTLHKTDVARMLWRALWM